MRDKKLKAITVKNIDPALMKKFKAACVENEIDMRAALLRFMEQYVTGNLWELAYEDNLTRENLDGIDNLFARRQIILRHEGENVRVKISRV